VDLRIFTDEVIAIDYNKERYIIYEYRIDQDIRSETSILIQIIRPAGSHISFRYISKRYIVNFCIKY